ncbi:MAG: 4-(cytidine 5'-diphospho)-2-C-methyl-D-erythritol kinase, partial [Pseudomonadota bacterium]|nr:4-(cytidine 5'-diphospho)-2-C-methyl-D-erythritol kinase [Pseudomonadota bacterium]
MYKLKSPAKLNLFLRVLSKRKDGFHNIQTYFQIIDLYDYISINSREDNLVMYSDNVEENILESNLCLKAINSLK